VARSHRRQYAVLQCRPCCGLGRTRISLNVLVVHRAAPRNLLCRQIVDLPFQVAGHDLGEAPHCVAPESPPSSQIRAWAGPPSVASSRMGKLSDGPFMADGYPAAAAAATARAEAQKPFISTPIASSRTHPTPARPAATPAPRRLLAPPAGVRPSQPLHVLPVRLLCSFPPGSWLQNSSAET